jgi:hypothetical protein
MSKINILIAVDGATLAQQVKDGSLSAGSSASPTNLGSYGSSNVYISMIAPNSVVSNGTQGDSELQISANGGDSVEWAITSFDNNFDNCDGILRLEHGFHRSFYSLLKFGDQIVRKTF